MKFVVLARGVVMLSAMGWTTTAARVKAGGSSRHPAQKEARLDLVEGYTDCAESAPANDMWWNKEAHGHSAPWSSYKGSYGASSYELPQRNVAVCTPCKNGCTFWKALLMRMDGNPLWNDPAPESRHNSKKNKLRQSWKVHHSAAGMALMLVRNPVARVLSAFLDKTNNMTGYYTTHMINGFATTPQDFQLFIKTIAEDVRQQMKADCHWTRQSDTCGLRKGASWDFYLKVECRALWAPSLFKKYGLGQFTNSGWGYFGKEPFIQSANRTGAALPTDIEKFRANDWKGSHDRHAGSVATICRYYTEVSFQDVVYLYAEDIKRFGYTQDVERLAALCKFQLPHGLLSA